MKRLSTLFVFVISFALLIANVAVTAQTNGGNAPKQPMAEKKPKKTDIHGVTLIDDYFWLREKTNPAVMAYLEKENSYAEELMKPTATLQEKIYNEMLSHIKQTD